MFKRTIAGFVGVPLGKELHLLRAKSAGLAKYGFKLFITRIVLASGEHEARKLEQCRKS